MKLDPREFHRMRFEAALQYLNNTAEEAWELADAFLAAGGYELDSEAEPRGGEDQPEPTSGDWSNAISESYEMEFLQDTDYYAHVARRAHALARERLRQMPTLEAAAIARAEKVEAALAALCREWGGQPVDSSPDEYATRICAEVDALRAELSAAIARAEKAERELDVLSRELLPAPCGHTAMDQGADGCFICAKDRFADEADALRAEGGASNG